ncbi:MAG: GNAT family N-acetyltransferase [Actinomycetota bacterium]|nr:GNAT family N-acetyltransferase [Actinomycetota bacterium]
MLLHLAQLNIATLRQPMDHADTAAFADGLAPVNAGAEASPGFVWRLQTEAGDATSIQVFPNPLTIVNLTMWESLQALRDFAYRGLHRDFFRRRGEWFESGSQAVMWWQPAGTVPTVQQAKARLDFADSFGPSPYAFEMGQQFPPLVVVPCPLDHPHVAPMLQQLDRELLESTPEGGSNFLHIAPEHVAEGNGAFYIAYLDGAPVACGAYRRIEGVPGAAEVKRMWASPAHRGAKLGAAVLATIEAAARADGFTELRLETGEHLTAAVGLYRKVGFDACPPWGEYVGVPHSYTMSKPLA